MKKVGIIIRVSPYDGGAYQYWLAIIDAICKTNAYKIYIFASKEWRNIAEKYGIDLIEFEGFGNSIQYGINVLMRNIMNKRTYSRYCHLWMPQINNFQSLDLDYCFTENNNVISNCLLNTKVIVPIFDLMHRYENRFEEISSNAKSRDKKFKFICKYADIILADSNIGKKQIYESYESCCENLENKIKILPYLPPDYMYSLEQGEKIDIRFDKFIFYPAQFWKHKNHKNLILAISKLKQQGIIVNLVLVGSEKNAGEEIRKIICQEKIEEQIQILGYVSNEQLVWLYDNAVAMTMPTFCGPTNIPPLESIVRGCPTLVSDVYGVREQLGDAALYFDPNSVDEIADCIAQVWNNEYVCKNLIEKEMIYTEKWNKEKFKDLLCKIMDNS